MISCAALRDLHRRRACDRGGSQPQPNLTISAHGYVPVAQHAYGRSQTSADRTPASRLIRHASQPVPPPERAGGSTAAWPSLAPCACFSLCSTRGALNFYRRLPNVTSHASPWHAYLRAVYHDDDFPLPFGGLRKMTVWYRDTAAWRARRPAPQVGLPLQSCVGHSKPHEVLFAATDRTSGLRHNRSQPACSEEVCREWLLPDDSRHELKPPAPAPPRPRQQSHSQQQQKSHFSSSSSSSAAAVAAEPTHGFDDQAPCRVRGNSTDGGRFERRRAVDASGRASGAASGARRALRRRACDSAARTDQLSVGRGVARGRDKSGLL